MNIKNKIRLALLNLSKSNLIITQHWNLLDANGKSIYKNSKVSDSLVGNFLQKLYCNFSNFNTTNWTASNYNGATANNAHIIGITGANIIIAGSDQGYMASVAGDLSAGIIFGTGTTAPSALDYKIETIIPEGVGANQLSYAVMLGSVAPSSFGFDTTFRVQRSATNNTGNDVPVSEVALYLKNAYGTFCIYRDLYTPSVTVPNLQTLNTIIEFKITT